MGSEPRRKRLDGAGGVEAGPVEPSINPLLQTTSQGPEQSSDDKSRSGNRHLTLKRQQLSQHEDKSYIDHGQEAVSNPYDTVREMTRSMSYRPWRVTANPMAIAVPLPHSMNAITTGSKVS